MKLSRLASALAAVAALAAPVAPAAQAQQGQQPVASITSSENAGTLLREQGCKPNYLIAVPGGANTVAGLPTFLPHGGQVFTTGLRSQAATGGRIQPLWVSYNSAAFATRPYFAVSADAYNHTRGTVAKLANACPHATFSLTGYSLGADVAARLTRDIAYGTGPIGPERLDAVALIANPYQGGNGAVLGPGTSPDSRGALGQLEGGYGQVSGRVLEICRADDIICSMRDNQRALVDPALRTTLAAGTVPIAEYINQFQLLGPDVAGLVTGMSAHMDYGLGTPQQAADWIVSHSPAH